MSTADALKLIGLDIVSGGVVIAPIGWTVQDVEDQVLFVLKVLVALTAIALNVYMFRKAHKKRNP